MRAISVFNLETGTSTRWCLAAEALRRRVRKSPMGSVCIIFLWLLPACFHDAGDFPLERHAAKTYSSHPKPPDIPARAAANTPTIAYAHLEPGLLTRLGHFCSACHSIAPPPRPLAAIPAPSA